MIDPTDLPPEPDADAGFWSQTEILAHILRFARNKGVPPYAMLGAVLRGVAARTPPTVQLPATIGGNGSLNLFTATVGLSGQGKDSANAAARDAVRFVHKLGDSHIPVPEPEYPQPGSGEGLARVFAGRKDTPGATAAHIQVPDVATLEALAGRKGQTLVGQLLQAWLGQGLGFTNASQDTTTAVSPHTYRLCLSVGVQPDNAAFFLSQEKDGFPQRFLWLPTADPGATKPTLGPKPVIPPMALELPDLSTAPDYPHILKIPDEVAYAVQDQNYRVLRRDEGVDPLDGHSYLTQLKIAAAIAIMHGRTEIPHESWKIAAQLIDVSNTVRAELKNAVAAKARRENTARALDQADREAIIRERFADHSQQRVALAITRKLERLRKDDPGKAATRRELRVACAVDIRSHFDPVLDMFLDTGFVVCCKGTENSPDMYKLGE